VLGEFGPWHIVIVLLVFAVLFGGRKLPDAARGLGQSIRIFRREMSGQNDTPAPPEDPTAYAQPSAPATAAPFAAADPAPAPAEAPSAPTAPADSTATPTAAAPAPAEFPVPPAAAAAAPAPAVAPQPVPRTTEPA
jgi:sec-independent protein translocase protein TatA